MNDQLATEARAAMVDALIVAALYRDQPVGAMVRLTVTEPGLARGRFLPFYGAFMPTRRRTTADIATARRAAQDGAGTRRVSALPALTPGLAREPWEFYTALALGDLRHVGVGAGRGRRPRALACRAGRLVGVPADRQRRPADHPRRWPPHALDGTGGGVSAVGGVGKARA
jgi:hypothetical protein